MKFLNHFGKTKEGRIIVFDIYTFNNLFTLLLNRKFSYEDALIFIFAKCDLNAYVFQECIHNDAYLDLTSREIDFKEAGRRSVLHQLALSFLRYG